ncbi:hypothetical protein ACFOU2_20110 [Bacillus songklensis]|uniref:Uncharacterized protein n=1 Tax=Bacillus songklensis TaxID=1069116 RepID=A0ABV8B8W7_9BACI
MRLLEHHRAYQKMYQKDKMTLGFSLPTAKMPKTPTMENQLQLARNLVILHDHYISSFLIVKFLLKVS